MIPWELAELAELLKVYERTYNPSCESIRDLIEEVERRLSDLPGGGYTAGNPRGAGRKRKITEEQKTAVRGLKAEGRTVRQISEETGLSIGSVHKLINEQ